MFKLNLLFCIVRQTILIVAWTLAGCKAFALVLNDIRKQAMAINLYPSIVMATLHNPSVVVSTYLNPSSELVTYQNPFVVMVAYQSSSIVITEDKAKVASSYNAVVEFELALVVH